MSESIPAKILAVDDEADFEMLLRQRFRHQIRAGEFDFRFAYHGEDISDFIQRPEFKKCAGTDEPQKYLPSLYSHPPMDAARPRRPAGAGRCPARSGAAAD